MAKDTQLGYQGLPPIEVAQLRSDFTRAIGKQGDHPLLRDKEDEVVATEAAAGSPPGTSGPP